MGGSVMGTAATNCTDPGRGTPRWGLLGGYPNRRARIAGTLGTGIWLLYIFGPVVDFFTHHEGVLSRGAGLAVIVLVFSAIYLILDLDKPLDGLINVSSAPMRSDLRHIDAPPWAASS